MNNQLIKKIDGKELIDFFKTSEAAKVLAPGLRATLATACREVLSTVGNTRRLVVSEAHIMELFEQMADLRPQYTKSTLAAYRSRFRTAVRLYMDYLDDPKGWAGRVRAGRPGQQIGGREEYKFPLRDGLMIRLLLPLDLTQAEARRLGTFVQSLATHK